VQVAAHPMSEPTEPFSNPPIKTAHTGRTLDRDVTFHPKEIYREKDLMALQVVKNMRENRERYWLGISGEGAGAAYDAVNR
jgi:hypothetical protein